jgi:hypothetical protein
LAFLAEALDTTDSAKDPEWLDTDLIALKGKTSMLYDDMRRVRKRMAGEGVRVGERKTNKRQRLSIEGTKVANGSGESHTPGSNRKLDADAEGQLTPPTKPPQAPSEPKPASEGGQEGAGQDETDHEYKVQYVDVTEEVNRRLRENRLRQLMDSPSTSQKRKRNALEEQEPYNQEYCDEEHLDLDSGRSPVKKPRASGAFEQVFKPNEASKRDANGYAWDEGRAERPKDEVKRRKI